MTESYIAIDLETRGLIEKGVVPDIICYSWATDDDSGVETNLSLFWDIVGNHRIVFHNANFDRAVLKGHGIDVLGYDDTMILSYCLDTAGQHNLRAWGDKLKFKKLECPWDGHYPEKYTPELEEYCKRDSELTIKLFHYLMGISDDIIKDLYYDVELPYSYIIQEMEATGMYFNREEVLKFHEEIQKQLSTIEHEIVEKVGDIPCKNLKTYKKEHEELNEYFVKQDEDGYHYQMFEQFNLNSRYHKAYALTHLYDWKPESFGKDGTPTVSGDILSKLSYPLAEDLQEISKLVKIDSSFIKPVLDYQDTHGFVYGSFNQCITITGRLSSSNPNMQNLPSRGELGQRMRGLIQSPSNDIDIVGGDLSNIEARVLAYYLDKVFKYPNMADAFVNNLDLHQQNADAWGLDRAMAKKVLYLTLYGGGASKLAKDSGLSQQEGQSIIDQVNKTTPAIEQLKNKVYEAIRKNGHLKTLGGRKLFYPDINAKSFKLRGRAERQSFNALLQGSAADILKILSIQSYHTVRKYGARYVAAVHDESLFYCDSDKSQQLAEDLASRWSNSGLLGRIPTTTEFKVGKKWSDTH